MAEGGESIRDMLAGFNSMQSQLGLLPQQSGGMPLGVQINQAPPPPSVMHPGQFAAMAMQQHQAAAQNTLQFAQMTRYAPPPSTPAYNPFTWGQTTSGVAGNQFNPQVANFMGGGQAQGMPNPIFSTAPQFGMYRPQGHGGGAQPFMPNVPSVFNPMVGPAGGAMFQPQYMRDFQVMRGQQGQMSAGVMGAAQGAFEMGGSIAGGAIGGAIGSMILPGIGTWAGEALGSWAGSAVGRGVGNMAVGTAGRDMMRGRQLQNTTAPFMVTGASLDPFTGQGLSRQAGIDTAVGLRQLTRDHDFNRQTGFNQADIMKLTQGASEQGLLATAQGGDEIVRKMKDISKAVRVLTQITGDPDVQHAMRDLGNMRNLGFSGLGNQMGALQNRAMFARMAGVSQASLDTNYGMPGAMMAQGVGLAGATGYAAGIAGAGNANVAVSGGAFSDLQLSRAGGRAGVSQTNALATIGAANQDLHMAAALTRKNGRLDFDVNAFRAAQQMSPDQVAREAERRMSSIGIRGISDLKTRMPEFKDRAAQLMGPDEGFVNAVTQIGNFADATGLGFGGAATQMMGGDAAAGRTIELQVESHGFWRGKQQQLEIQRRALHDRTRAQRAVNRTGGLFTQIGQGISGALGAVSDDLAEGVRRPMEYLDERAEERSAFSRGERITRYDKNALMRTENDRGLAAGAMASSDFGRGAPAGTLTNGGGVLNELGTGLGISSLSDRNKVNRLASMSRGELFGSYDAYGQDAKENLKRLDSVSAAGGLVASSRGFTGDAEVSGMGKIQKSLGGLNAHNIVQSAAQILGSNLPKATLLRSAGALDAESIKKAGVQALTNAGMNQKQAEAYMDSPEGRDMSTAMIRRLSSTADSATKDVLDRTEDITARRGTLNGTSSVAQAHEDVTAAMTKAGITRGGVGGVSEETYNSVTSLVRTQDPRALALAALRQGAADADSALRQYDSPTARKRVAKMQERLREFGEKNEKDMDKLSAGANAILDGSSANVHSALGNMGSLSQGNLVDNITNLRGAGAREMGTAAVQHAYGQLGDQLHGDFANLTDVSEGGRASVLKKLALLGDDQIAKLSPAMQKIARQAAAAKGDPSKMKEASKAFDANILQSGPSGTTTLGSSSEEGDAALNASLDQLKKMEARFAKSDKPEDQVMQTFAKGVETFAEAAQDLKAATEAMAIANGLPGHQATK